MLFGEKRALFRLQFYDCRRHSTSQSKLKLTTREAALRTAEIYSLMHTSNSISVYGKH